MRRKQLARAFPVWLIFLLGMLVGQAVGQSGAVDGTFNPGSGVNGAVYAMAVQADGKLVIGGEFTAFNGIPRSNLARLNADGSLDTTFTPGSIAGRVEALVVQSDGKVVIGGVLQRGRHRAPEPGPAQPRRLGGYRLCRRNGCQWHRLCAGAPQ